MFNGYQENETCLGHKKQASMIETANYFGILK